MKKTLLALAITALSANAFALELGTDPALKYASEIKFDAAGTEITLAQSVDTAVGFSINSGTVRYVRFDIANAEFDVANVATSDLDLTAVAPSTGAITPTVSAVDSNKKYVIFEITASADVANTDVLNFAPRILAKSAGNVSIQYRLYETGVAALAGSSDVLASKSGTVVTFAPALSLAVTPEADVDQIDVTQESKFFSDTTGETEADLGNVDVKVDGTVLWADGSATTIADLVSDTANANAIVITGDFSSAADVKLGGTSVATANLTATTATFPLTNAAAVDAINNHVFFITNGTDAISPSGFSATLDLTPAAAATGVTGSTATDLSGALASLEKNGSSDEVDLALKPGGVFSNYVRISNTSGLEGKIFVTVIADDGQTASLALNEIAGQPATLAARASTTQMTIQQIFDAAAAKGLALSGEGKLRLIVEGEVPSLSVQTYTVSKDYNSFATF